MNKYGQLFLVCILFVTRAIAQTTHVVEVSNNQFTPDNISSVLIGDKIKWQWLSGFHTTSSTSTPVGAPAWDSDMNSSSPTFEYTITRAGTYTYLCNVHGAVMSGTFTVSAPLPVKLSEFKLTTVNSKPVLAWQTLFEQNTDYFSLRKSINGNIYNEVARIAAAGNSLTEKTYSYTDNNISSKNKYSYYILAIVDKDGKQQFSETRIFKNTMAQPKLILSLSPNPISNKGHVLLKFNSDKKGVMNVDVLNVQGKNVLTNKLDAFIGINNGHVHLGELPVGTYTIIFRLNGLEETHRVVRQ